MSEELLERLRVGQFHKVSFREFTRLVEGFGFTPRRGRGSHHIYSPPDVPERFNLQPVRGQAKPYQIRDFLRQVERFRLRWKDQG